ncbi:MULTISPECIES: DUF58 domain-containing protein [Pseudomonas]|uniref:DUF58 domain-containing protein n=1 Tax=Pseudomonas putida NBRC 14164 TaxID=1211579 RepID=A0ABN5UNS9_PSEPU|nr:MULTISPECIES: DUF58 domain-containing protein [Pseudomonas]EKT4554725.1 DUF58 domain-containing protein [Pseudomonas putida]MCX9135093.1 DUF58 domain-containing protein [Pseudomonas sp. DCB_PUT]MDD1971373.1 DUF58 domain-containing protein [Pseudomonas putida]MDO1463596.1 DUF58 domain-containing protein [Pseudomonas putida]MDO1468973.1 DUF58 domain-containing protein [Pseudomonas putida]
MQPTQDGFVYASLSQLMAFEHRVRGLSFLAHQPLASILAGNHASRLRGRGLSFDELRRYIPGDDLRHLDWRASLRYGKPFVRTFTEERDRPTLLLVDQRMNMYFGSRRSFKSVTAAELAALSAWIALQAGDRVGGLVLDDEQVVHIKPLRSRARVQALCAAVVHSNNRLSAAGPDSEQEGQLDAMLRAAIGLAGHDALVCIISDFAGVTEQTLKLLRQLSAHNDVIAMQVYDPIALDVPDKGRLSVTQGEMQIELEVGRRQVHRPLGEFLSGRLQEVAQLLRRSQIPLMMISTGDEVLGQVQRELGRLGGTAR